MSAANVTAWLGITAPVLATVQKCSIKSRLHYRMHLYSVYSQRLFEQIPAPQLKSNLSEQRWNVTSLCDSRDRIISNCFDHIRMQPSSLQHYISVNTLTAC